jgi:hypothetical protein
MNQAADCSKHPADDALKNFSRPTLRNLSAEPQRFAVSDRLTDNLVFETGSRT